MRDRRPDRVPDAVALFDAGVALARSGDHVRAEQYLLAAQAAGYPESRVVPRIVSLCLRASRIRTALYHARPYLHRHGEDTRFAYLIATLQLALNQPAEAITTLDDILRRDPDLAEAHYLRGRIYRDQLANFAHASAAFRSYLRLGRDARHRSEASSFLDAQRGTSPRGPVEDARNRTSRNAPSNTPLPRPPRKRP